MKKPSIKAGNGMRVEYDFSRGVRGKYFRRYHRGANVVVLEPDVAKVFSNAGTVTIPSMRWPASSAGKKWLLENNWRIQSKP